MLWQILSEAADRPYCHVFRLPKTPSNVEFDGLVQNSSNSIANALEILQSRTKTSKCNQMRLK